MWGWVIIRSVAVRSYPVPLDAPHAESPGPHPFRVLIIGGGPAVGRGVVTHDLALPGQLRRAISSLTHRGVHIDLVSGPWMPIRRLVRTLRHLTPGSYDAIIAFVGVDDSLTLVPLSVWRRGITELLGFTHGLDPRPRLFLVGIQPIRSIPVFDARLGDHADAHAVRLNAISAALCAADPRATFLPFRDADRPPEQRFRDATGYARIASLLAAGLRRYL